MQITIETRPPAAIETEALVSYVFEQDNPIEGAVAELDRIAGGALRKLAASGEITGKSLEMTLLHSVSGLAAERLLLVGAGKPEKFDAAELRRLAGAALRHLKARSVKRLVFLARENDRNTAAAEAITEGLLIAGFESDKYKTEKKNGKEVETAVLAGWGTSAGAQAERAVARGRIIAEAQNFTRELVNEPSNRLTPRMLADRAAAMAAEAGLAVEILDERKMRELKMGALLSVAQGSDEPPRLIVVTYTPPQPRSGAPVIGLVGKAITFDTGGISIKSADGMEKMKYDMAGGATMLGVMRALAQLKPPVKVIAVVPATENMPGGHAQKPGDVQIALSGKSIEVFGSDRGFTDRLLASARAAGEKMWPMPLDDDYREMIKSSIADIQNVCSGKVGGAITAAMFLKEFAGETPWIHLDIAGTAWLDAAKTWAAKGASGVAVRTLVDFVMNFDAKEPPAR